MNKVNLCWVFSDGQKGHEIQSMTLAQTLAEHVECIPFTLNQPWLTFAPRRLPRFDLALRGSMKPDLKSPPNLIVTTGRKAAAVGKHYKDKLAQKNLSCKHIQILNPKDDFKKYDWVLLPKHDSLSGANVIQFTGSIHPYNRSWFSSDKNSNFNQYIAIMIGNPKKAYFQTKMIEEIQKIQQSLSPHPLFFCGSPRLDPKYRRAVTQLTGEQDRTWFSTADGKNPYLPLLKNAKKIFVTSDSINMVNEACASQAPVSILALDFVPSPKHMRFLTQIKQTWEQDFSSMQKNKNLLDAQEAFYLELSKIWAE